MSGKQQWGKKEQTNIRCEDLNRQRDQKKRKLRGKILKIKMQLTKTNLKQTVTESKENSCEDWNKNKDGKN